MKATECVNPRLAAASCYCAGSGEDEQGTLPWRVLDDLTYVAYNKEPMLLCQLLCKLARENGFSEVQVQDHLLTPKVWAFVDRRGEGERERF